MPTIERVRHMGIAKTLLIKLIMRDGASAVLRDWTGTDKEAIEQLRLDPRTVLTDCDCIKDATGACTGESPD